MPTQPSSEMPPSSSPSSGPPSSSSSSYAPLPSGPPTYGPPPSDPHDGAPGRPDLGEHGIRKGSPITPWLMAAGFAALFTLGAFGIYADLDADGTTWVGLIGVFAVLTLALGLVFLRIRTAREARNNAH